MPIPPDRFRRSMDFDVVVYAAIKAEAKRTNRSIQGMMNVIMQDYIKRVRNPSKEVRAAKART